MKQRVRREMRERGRDGGMEGESTGYSLSLASSSAGTSAGSIGTLQTEASWRESKYIRGRGGKKGRLEEIARKRRREREAANIPHTYRLLHQDEDKPPDR